MRTGTVIRVNIVEKESREELKLITFKFIKAEITRSR